jgi:FkbM family methyltransferase
MLGSLKSAAVKWVRPKLAGVTYTAQRGLIKGMRRRGGFSFVPGSQLSAEEQFLLSLDLTGKTIFDVGGWEGVYTMFFARAAGQQGRVVTFEPNPANRLQIEQNVGLNDLRNVTLRPVALGDQLGTGTLVVEGGIAGEGHVVSGANPGRQTGDTAIEITIRSLDEEIAEQQLPLPDLVKIDVEGFEVNVLRGMRGTITQAGPAIFVEVHRDSAPPDNSREVIRLLLGYGYELQHVESGTAVTDEQHHLAHSDHLYAQLPA